MAEETGISWTDSTFNGWMGCTKVSPACDHCYAERDTRRFGQVEWGAGKARIRTVQRTWGNPVRWNKAEFYECTACGMPIRAWMRFAGSCRFAPERQSLPRRAGFRVDHQRKH